MNRRHFLTSLAAAGAARATRSFAQPPAQSPLNFTLTLTPSAPSPTIPADFTGLSYESAQLANPGFFSAANTQLIQLFRSLSHSGNLRIGGGSSNFTTYSDAAPTAPPFAVFGPDTDKTVKRGTVTSALALRNLRAFLDACNWSCLYGLNLGQGTRQNAAAEAEAAQRILGPRLLAFQIGNEPDSFRNRYRPATYSPADFIAEWLNFHAAIVARTPSAKFAGPDISNKLAFLTAFAEIAPAHKDIILLTDHYYAMGPAGNPNATLAQLLDPDPKLATLHQRQLPEVAAAIQTAGLPFRIAEANSCWNGGQLGVSDTFASALWCADTMLRFASYGWSGINLHGGGNGIYSPIVGSAEAGFSRRPEYFGIQFARRFTGAQFLTCALAPASPHVTAYALQLDRRTHVAILNKGEAPIRLTLPALPTGHATTLTAPAIDRLDGIQLAEIDFAPALQVSVPAYSGMIYELAGPHLKAPDRSSTAR